MGCRVLEQSGDPFTRQNNLPLSSDVASCNFVPVQSDPALLEMYREAHVEFAIAILPKLNVHGYYRRISYF